MIELKFEYVTVCSSCGEYIEQGEKCYAESFTEPVEVVFCEKCMDDPSINIKKVVKIDPEGRFIFFIDADTPKRVLDELSEAVREWWESGDKFLFAMGELTLARLSNDGEAEVVLENEG